MSLEAKSTPCRPLLQNRLTEFYLKLVCPSIINLLRHWYSGDLPGLVLVHGIQRLSTFYACL